MISADGNKEKDKIFFWALSSPSSIEKHIPFIQAARKLNLTSVLVSHEPNEQLLCADENHVIPLHDWQALHSLAKEAQPILVMTQNCRLTPFLAPLALDLGIKCYTKNAAQILAYKDRWHHFLEQKGIPSPKTILPLQEFDFTGKIGGENPVVLKPSFSTGSVNTFVFENIHDLLLSLQNNSVLNENTQEPISLSEIFAKNRANNDQGGYLVQEYVPFQWQLGVEVFILNGQVNLIHPAEILIDESGYKAYAHLGPIPIPPIIKDWFQDIALQLGLFNCHLSPDILIGTDGNPYIIDVNLNIGGEGLIEAVKSRGLDYANESLKSMLGLKANWDCQKVAVVNYALPSFKDSSHVHVSREDSLDFPLFAKQRLDEWRDSFPPKIN